MKMRIFKLIACLGLLVASQVASAEAPRSER